MLVFNNQQRSGYEELVSYGPKFYTSIKEMDTVYKFAGWTLDLMAEDLEKLISFQFIKYMNDETLTRFENFIGISRDDTKSLEERRTLAYANWCSSGKMSKTKIKNIINAFVECECDVTLDGSVLNINMVFKGDPSVYMGDIRELLRKTIPAHIEILYKGTVDTNITFTWTEQVRLEKVSHVMEFHMYRAIGGIMLDGYYLLDGSEFLNNSFTLFPVADKHRLEINNKENATFCVLVSKNLFRLDGTRTLDGSLEVNSYYKKEDL